MVEPAKETSPMPFMRKTFDDIDDLCHSLKTWNVEMYPLASNAPTTSAADLVQTGFDGGLYGFAGFGSPLRMSGEPPRGLITFNVMEPSKRDYWWRGHNLDSAMVWVFPVGGELQSISPPGFKVHTLSVTEERIAEVAATCRIDLPAAYRRPEVFLPPETDRQCLRSSLYRMSDCSTPFCYENLHEILLKLVPHWLDPDIRAHQRRPSMHTRNRALRKSLEIINECDLKTVTVELLLENCHVSKRTLEYAFRDRFNSSPAALIKSIRLAATKAALRRTITGQQTIAEIAAKYGFRHPAQFATDYRKAFNELPSETLRNTY